MQYLILADIHANAPALEAVLETETDWDEILFLGDAVDYGPHPTAVIDRLRGLSGTFLAGNHDRSIAESPRVRPPANRVDFSQWTRDQLASADRSFLEGFEDTQVIHSGGHTIRIHHGNFNGRLASIDIPGRLRPTTDAAAFAAVGGVFSEPMILYGHSHTQYEIPVNGTRFVNPGSVGRPTRNGIGAQYALLEDGEITLREVSYDAASTIARMEDLPIDEEHTIWQRCLERELYQVRRAIGDLPTAADIDRQSRYAAEHYIEEFGSVERGLVAAGLRNENEPTDG